MSKSFSDILSLYSNRDFDQCVIEMLAISDRSLVVKEYLALLHKSKYRIFTNCVRNINYSIENYLSSGDSKALVDDKIRFSYESLIKALNPSAVIDYLCCKDLDSDIIKTLDQSLSLLMFNIEVGKSRLALKLVQLKWPDKKETLRILYGEN